MAAKKKNNLSQKINSALSTPFRKGLVVVLIFAVVGGGILVYRSFASTFLPVNRPIVTRLSRGMSTWDVGNGACKSSSEYDNGWKFNTALLNCNTLPTGVNWDFTQVNTKDYEPYMADKWKVCAWVKGKATVEFDLFSIKNRVANSSRTLIQEQINVNSPNSYTYVCSTKNTGELVYRGNSIQAYIRLYANKIGSNSVRVAYLNMEVVK